MIHPFHKALPADSEQRLGPKGVALCRMTLLGVPVPPGFIVESGATLQFVGASDQWPVGLRDGVVAALGALSDQTGSRLGDPSRPLLLAVRSGASAAGVGESVLDLGLTKAVVEAGVHWAGSQAAALHAWRRFVRGYAEVVLGVHRSRFDRVEAAMPTGWAHSEDVGMLTGLAERMLAVVREMGLSIPDDPVEQLVRALTARMTAYAAARARYHRRQRGLPDEAGASIIVQRRVIEHLGSDSGNGRVSSRDPRTGAPGLVGEWIAGNSAEGGESDGQPIDGGSDAFATHCGAAREQLSTHTNALEKDFRDAIELDFVVERGALWIVGAAPLRRSAAAAVQIAVDLCDSGAISKPEALLRVDPRVLETLLRPVIAVDKKGRVIAKGLDASPGAATGRVAFDVSECEDLAAQGEPAILVRVDTTPEDLQAFAVAAGVLTQRGGQTSHAAVAAREKGVPCIVGCQEISVDPGRSLFYANDAVVRKGDWLTIDGGTGEVMLGRVETVAPEAATGALGVLLGWADGVARLRVLANADTAADALRARALGARGVGLCRTEHSFFQPDSLRALRRAILAEDGRARSRALAEVLPQQREAFAALFRAMDGYPVCIRLLDPPMTSFLPTRPEDVSSVAAELGMRSEALAARVETMRDVNPMLGNRGVRVGLLKPELYRMQVRALYEAACAVANEGVAVFPEVMVPFVAHPNELKLMRALVHQVADAVMAEQGRSIEVRVGTMIELPRAALLADQVAVHADFFSFGTNDLTQTVWGLSRDDLGQFLPAWLEAGVVTVSPMTQFDEEGVGALVEHATRKGRQTKPSLELTACGEHAGDPSGIAFFHRIGLDAVSCSPFRVPVARLAAGVAALS